MLIYLDYVEDLIESSVQQRMKYPSYLQAEEGIKGRLKSPPPLCSKKTKVDKHLAVQSHQSRFAKHKVIVPRVPVEKEKANKRKKGNLGKNSCAKKIRYQRESTSACGPSQVPPNKHKENNRKNKSTKRKLSAQHGEKESKTEAIAYKRTRVTKKKK